MVVQLCFLFLTAITHFDHCRWYMMFRVCACVLIVAYRKYKLVDAIGVC